MSALRAMAWERVGEDVCERVKENRRRREAKVLETGRCNRVVCRKRREMTKPSRQIHPTQSTTNTSKPNPSAHIPTESPGGRTINNTLSRTLANWIAREHEVVVLPAHRDQVISLKKTSDGGWGRTDTAFPAYIHETTRTSASE